MSPSMDRRANIRRIPATGWLAGVLLLVATGTPGLEAEIHTELLPFAVIDPTPLDAGYDKPVHSRRRLYGYMDRNGKVVIAPQFEERAGFFTKEGTALVQRDGQDMLIDASGRNRNVDCDEIKPDREQGFICGRNQRYGYIGPDGRTICENRYEEFYPYSRKEAGGDTAVVKLGGAYGHVDRACKETIPARYPWLSNLYNGFVAYREGDRYGHLDRNGRVVVPAQFDDFNYFFNGRTVTTLRGKHGLMDDRGNVILPPTYDAITNHAAGDELISFRSGDSWGFLDARGQIALPAKHDAFFPRFVDGLAVVSDESGHNRYIDTSGRYVFEPFFEKQQSLSPFHAPGIAVASRSEEFVFRSRFIDRKGRALSPDINHSIDLNDDHPEFLRYGLALHYYHPGGASDIRYGVVRTNGQKFEPIQYLGRQLAVRLPFARFCTTHGLCVIFDAERGRIIRPQLEGRGTELEISNGSGPPADGGIVVETGTHAGRINGLDTDAAGKLLVTCGDDRSARLWNADDGKLLRTVRTHGGRGDDGKIHACALSPDGRLLAVGGETAHDGDRYGLFLIDTQSGAQRKLVWGFRNYVRALRFSPDGKTLAVGLVAHSDVKFFCAPDFRICESSYGRSATRSLSYSRDGRMIAASHTGAVLYSRDRTPVHDTDDSDLTGGRFHLYDADFRADGVFIAIAYSDVQRGLVVEADSLKFMGELSTEGLARTQGLNLVAWSADNRRLFGAGRLRLDGDDDGAYIVRRWNVPDDSAATDRLYVDHEDWKATTAAVLGMRALPDGGVVMISADGEILRLASNGKPRWRNEPRRMPFATARTEPDALRSSADLDRIAVRATDGRTFLVQVSAGSVTAAGAQDDLRSAPDSSARIRMSRWQDGELKVNGRKADFVSGSVWSVAAGADFGIVGSTYGIYRVNIRGQKVYETAVPAPVRSLALSADGALFMAAFQDGTLRWYRSVDGVELLALYVPGDGRSFAWWTPAGQVLAAGGSASMLRSIAAGNQGELARETKVSAKATPDDLSRALR